MKIKSYLFTFGISLCLAACGGGSSSGGANQSRDLTFCVSETVEERDSTITNFTSKDYTYINSCGETVNLSFVRIASNDISTVTLGVNETHSQTTIFSLKFIACRPPSIGIDSDSGTLFAQLECS